VIELELIIRSVMIELGLLDWYKSFCQWIDVCTHLRISMIL